MEPYPDPLPESLKRELLSAFVLGTEVQIYPLPPGYGEAPHDDWMDAAPDPNTYPEDCP